jgi:ABC-type nickel/cobalt efflux system permease component RcnA
MHERAHKSDIMQTTREMKATKTWRRIHALSTRGFRPCAIERDPTRRRHALE